MSVFNKSYIGFLILLCGMIPINTAFAEPDCLPSQNEYEKRASFEDDDGLYSYYYVSKGEPFLAPFLTFETSTSCEIVAGPENYFESTDVFVDEHLPFEIATELYSEFYRKVVDNFGGVEAYQSAIDASSNTEDEAFPYVSPALESSLEDIGIKLPDTSLRISSNKLDNYIYQKLTQLQSPLFSVSSVEEIRYVDNYFLMGYELDNEEGLVFASLNDEVEIEVFYLGSREDYDPEIISYEHQIPLSIFEGFAE